MLNPFFANQCRDDAAQRSSLDLEQAHEIALHLRSVVGQVVQHEPLRGAEIVGAWHAGHDVDGKVLRRDLGVGEIPCVDKAWIAAAFTPAGERTSSQREVLALSDELVRELKQADEYVLGVPMYNFGVPAALKLWIDQVVRIGETYGFDGKEGRGLLAGKKAHVFVSSGGIYDPATPAATVNFVDPYLQAILDFIGVTDVEVYAAGGASAIMRKQQSRDEFLAPHLNNVK